LTIKFFLKSNVEVPEAQQFGGTGAPLPRGSGSKTDLEHEYVNQFLTYSIRHLNHSNHKDIK
jgi:hypothetical protein